MAREIGKPLENKGIEVVYCKDNTSAACNIVEKIDKSNTIFLKASRSMKFEEILEQIKK